MKKLNKVSVLEYIALLVFIFLFTKRFTDYRRDLNDRESLGSSPTKTIARILNRSQDIASTKTVRYFIWLKYALINGDSTVSTYRNTVSEEYRVGKEVEIIYQKENPKNFFFEEDNTTTKEVFGMILSGIIVLLIISKKVYYARLNKLN